MMMWSMRRCAVVVFVNVVSSIVVFVHAGIITMNDGTQYYQPGNQDGFQYTSDQLLQQQKAAADAEQKLIDLDIEMGTNNYQNNNMYTTQTYYYGTTAESSYKATYPATLARDNLLGSDFGETQVLDANYQNEILQIIQDARTYLHDEVNVLPKYEKVRGMCENKHTQCAFWAALGECHKNIGYMHTHCAPVCKTCDKLSVEERCPIDPDAFDALQPGDLNRMFERIVTDPWYQQYEPIVLSRPSYAPGDTAENATYQIGIWLVMFDKAMTSEEADRMIELGGIEGYERSSDVGEELPDGTFTANINSGRTSTNAWCTGVCSSDPIAQRLAARVENITGIPETNSENFQLLRYEQGQYYQSHNDYIPYQRNRPTGVRILTFYFYLNDVEEGGGTNFPHLGMTVQPKKGRAVLWPSVYNQNPDVRDSRSEHQALPVIKGVKYGCNAWIHMRDFKGPNARGC